MKKSILAILFLCLTVIFFTSSESSALMIGLNISGLTKASEVVLKGKVVKTTSYWGEGDFIVTRASLRVQKVIKGKVAQKKIVVEYLGGEIGDIGFSVSDMPTLKRGENVILFLESQKAENNTVNENVYKIVGNAQGKYTVGSDNVAKRSGFCVVNEESIVDEDNVIIDDLINKIEEVK